MKFLIEVNVVKVEDNKPTTPTPGRKIDFYVAGTKYHDGISIAKALAAGDKLTLKKEPTNPHDHCAVEIFYRDAKLGYVPAKLSMGVSYQLDFADDYSCVIDHVDPTARPHEMIHCVFTWS